VTGRAARRTSLQAGRVAVFVLICATYFVGVLPPGVCFCELEGGSCCGPTPAWGSGEGEASDAGEAAASTAACCDGCAARSRAPEARDGAAPADATRAAGSRSGADAETAPLSVPLT